MEKDPSKPKILVINDQLLLHTNCVVRSMTANSFYRSRLQAGKSSSPQFSPDQADSIY